MRALPRDQAARHDHGHLHEPPAQAEAGLGAHGTHRRSQPPEPEAARDRADLHLRHRPADGAQGLRRARPLARHEGARPDRRGGHASCATTSTRTSRSRATCAASARRRSSACRRSAPTAASATGAACPVQRPAHEDERPHAQGPEEDRRPRQEGASKWHLLVSTATRGRTRRRVTQEHRDRPGAHQDVVQQHDRRR